MAANTQRTLPFPPWVPDLSPIGSASSVTITNVYPRKDGYGPFPSLQAFTQALPASCRGFFFARKTDGTIAIFAGTSTDLYQLNNTTFQWTRVSKGGISYSPLVATANWQFAQFNDLVIATQVNTAPQKFTLSSSSAFADLGGSPPQAAFVAIVGFFVVLTGLLSNPRRAQWSDLDAPESWTAGVGLSDFQDMSDGGNVVNVSGGDQYGVLFQEESIRSLVYAPGSPAIFQINRLSTQESLFGNNSIINIGNMVFYCGAAGFKMTTAAGAPVPIGKDRVDRYFFQNVDKSNLQLLVGASDPNFTRVYWAFKSIAGQAGLFDTVLLYDYVLDQWALLKVSGEWLGSLAKPGLTLENMDAIALGALQVTGTANNGSGAIRLALSATSNQYFNIAGQNFIEVQGVLGTTEANGSWAVTIIDAHHIDLIGSTYTNAYVSGGAIGGSLETIPFSFDSISNASVAQIAAMNSLGQLCFFTGPNLEASLETADGDPQASTVEINGARPITDSPAAFVSIGTRLAANAPIVYSAEYPIDDQSWAEAYVETRYARGHLRIPAGTAWTFATGIQPDVSIAGEA